GGFQFAAARLPWFSVVRSMEEFNPALISHTLALIACLDTDGYSCASIISTLEQEGAQ
ncbi:hypothetical protein ACEOTO_005609, partial [Klebsiella pneumoniae]